MLRRDNHTTGHTALKAMVHLALLRKGSTQDRTTAEGVRTTANATLQVLMRMRILFCSQVDGEAFSFPRIGL